MQLRDPEKGMGVTENISCLSPFPPPGQGWGGDEELGGGGWSGKLLYNLFTSVKPLLPVGCRGMG